MSAPVGFGGARQRGISLLVVMIVVLLSSLLALWAFRSSLVNEAIVGNDADYQRAFEAAQAMIQDAEMDIRGERADGALCTVDGANLKVCRSEPTAAFINENKDLGALLSRLQNEGPRNTGCLNAICLKRVGIQDFWSDKDVFDAMTAANVGARYGEYTGATFPADSKANANPLLAETRAGLGAWYWIEIMPYDASPAGLMASQPKMELNLNPNVVYRITAVARGLKPRTQVVLQSAFVRQKLRN
ncbi:pilus assembly PilX family protein [Pseudorhodoferax sp.]|uniref:pilus assembly PilX family protein n=1 Tax=Pseudorhodoferax sp. TaxID=1993553 RepID=UPI002DD6532C|nr:pilus assembly protein [Pseudorhodoferax sp.]